MLLFLFQGVPKSTRRDFRDSVIGGVTQALDSNDKPRNDNPLSSSKTYPQPNEQPLPQVTKQTTKKKRKEQNKQVWGKLNKKMPQVQ